MRTFLYLCEQILTLSIFGKMKKKTVNRLATLLLIAVLGLSQAFATPTSVIQQKADSLRAVLNNCQGEERAGVLKELFKLYFASNQVEPATIVLDELIGLEQQLKHPEREASARWNKIALLNNAGRYETLLDEAEEQMQWFKEHEMWDRYYQVWQRKCSANHDLRRLQSAMREARAMQEDAHRRKNNIGRAMSYKQIAIVYYDIRELKKATDAFENSAALLVEEHDSTGMLSGVYEGLCQSLDGRGLYDEELATAQTWEQYMHGLMSKHGIQNVSPPLVTCHLTQAAAYLGMKQYDQVRSAIQKAREYQKMGQSALTQYYLYEMQVRLALAEGRNEQALQYSDSALNLKLTVDNKIYELRAEALMRTGRAEEAAALYDDLYHRQDTLYTSAMQSQLDEQYANFQTEEMERDRRMYRILLTSVIAAAVIVLLVAFTLYRRHENRKLKLLNEQLKHANQRAEESSRMKSEFIKNISHEIRTPLNILNGFTQIILEPGMEMDDKTKENMRTRIRENSDRITELVNKMLDLSDANSQTFIELNDDVSPLDVITQAALLAHIDQQTHIHFQQRIEPDARGIKIHTNRKQLIRVLTLLLYNAVKFTPKGDVTIRVTHSQEEHLVRFFVEDTGIGIPEEEAEHIFEEFVQLNEYVDGTGIGLTVARRIARRLGGDIKLDTTYTGGSRFVVTLPQL